MVQEINFLNRRLNMIFVINVIVEGLSHKYVALFIA